MWLEDHNSSKGDPVIEVKLCVKGLASMPIQTVLALLEAAKHAAMLVDYPWTYTDI